MLAELNGLYKKSITSLSFLSSSVSKKKKKKPQNLNAIFSNIWIHLHINTLLIINPVKVEGQDDTHPTPWLSCS